MNFCPIGQIPFFIRQKNTNPSHRLKQDIKQKASIKLHTNITHVKASTRTVSCGNIHIFKIEHSAHIVNNKSWMPFKFSDVIPPVECVFVLSYHSYVTKLPG